MTAETAPRPKVRKHDGEQRALLEGASRPAATRCFTAIDSAQKFLVTAYARGRMHHAILIEGAGRHRQATLGLPFAIHVTGPTPIHWQPLDRIADPDIDEGRRQDLQRRFRTCAAFLALRVDERPGKMKSVITVTEGAAPGKFSGQDIGPGKLALWRSSDPGLTTHRNAANANPEDP